MTAAGMTAAMASIRSMRGGAQSKLLFCLDGAYYVVKFSNNTQHRRVLINEWLATHLAMSIGLSVPTCKIISVTPDLIASDPLMRMEMPRGQWRLCEAGPQFGSLFMPDGYEYLPPDEVANISNIAEFAGILCFDKWTCNEDGRQALFTNLEQGGCRATFIDHGFCFGAADWVFRDAPLKGICRHKTVYHSVVGWSSFEPWLSRIESIGAPELRCIIESIPSSWFDGDYGEFMQLADKLLLRRERVRSLVYEYGKTTGNFPNWLP